MATVYHHYARDLAAYVRSGFALESEGRTLRFDGARGRFELHDLVAETFRRAFEPAARLAYNGVSPYQAYLRAISRNLVLDELRRRRPPCVLDEQTAGERLSLSPEASYQVAELAALIRGFEATLAPAERRLLSLRYREGLSQEDVARRERRSRRWVRSVEESLRRRLIRHLRGTGYLSGAGELGVGVAHRVRS